MSLNHDATGLLNIDVVGDGTPKFLIRQSQHRLSFPFRLLWFKNAERCQQKEHPLKCRQRMLSCLRSHVHPITQSAGEPKTQGKNVGTPNRLWLLHSSEWRFRRLPSRSDQALVT